MRIVHVTPRIATLSTSLWLDYSTAIILRRAVDSQRHAVSRDSPAGEPRHTPAIQFGDDRALELPSTSHISIVDAQGTPGHDYLY